MKIRLPVRVLSLMMTLVMLTALTVPVCAENATALQAHTVEEKVYQTYLGSLSDTLTQPYPLYFIDGVYDLPYVELELWTGLMNLYFVELMGDDGYSLTMSENKNVVTLTRENGYTLQLDFDQDKMVFDDYDAFVHTSMDSTLIDLVSESGVGPDGEIQLIQRDRQASFERYGDMMTVDLASYRIDLIEHEGCYYVPLQTMDDFMLLPSQCSFTFNGQAMFLVNDNALFSYEDGAYTEYAELYYDVPTAERSDALAEYSYHELCLALDTFYGLKEPHDIQTFRELFWQIGYDEVLSGNDAHDADLALKSVIDYYLDDLHSSFNEFSPMAGLDAIENSRGFASRQFEEHRESYRAAREEAYPDGILNYEEVGNTAYITFDSFRSVYVGGAFYDARENGEFLDDTIGLITYAHSQITRDDSPIENVVLDLSNNTGGAVDAAIVVLSWFLGDASFSVKNMATGAMSTSIYRADVNLDRTFDAKDTVADKKLYCLISPVSFSCGNLVPAAFKASQRVTLLGRTSGGGSCIVQPMTTAYGTVFQISSADRMSFLKNGSFYDIDKGIEPDYYINSIANFYDRQALTEYINNMV